MEIFLPFTALTLHIIDKFDYYRTQFQNTVSSNSNRYFPNLMSKFDIDNWYIKNDCEVRDLHFFSIRKIIRIKVQIFALEKIVVVA